jgi:soluble lytic murein transglycosylase-like protein
MEIQGLDNIVSRLAGKAAKASACPSRETADAAKARKACREFESILLYRMLSTMRKAFQDEEGDDSGFGGDIFKSMMDEQLSLALAKSGGIGLASLLEKALGLESGEGRPRPGKEVRISPVRTRERGIAPSRVTRKQEASAAEAKEGTGRSRGTKAVTGGLGSVLKVYDSTIRAASQVFGVSADLIRAVIMQESGGDPGAVSHKGAKGLMQLTDPTARDLGVTDPFDPVQNIFGGTRFLANMLKNFKGNLELALASYNAGPGAVEKYGGIPPYKETQNYVKGVLGRLESLRSPGIE